MAGPEGAGSSMISRGCGDDSTFPLIRAEAGELVQATANLERPCYLVVLELQEDLASTELLEVYRSLRRSIAQLPADYRVGFEDVIFSGHVF